MEIYMEEKRVEDTKKRCPAYIDMSNGSCTLRFKCDLDEGHDGKHFSMAEPPHKIATVAWSDSRSGNEADVDDWEQALVRIRKIVSYGFYSEILNDIRDALKEAGF